MLASNCREDSTLELALLGGVLLWPESRHAARLALPEDGFSDVARASLWRHLLASWDAGIVPDSLTLAERLSVDCRGPGVSPISAIEIESYSAYAPGRAEAVEGIAKRLAQIALGRRCEQAARRIVATAADQRVSAEELAQFSQTEILRATTESKQTGPVAIEKLAEEYWYDLEARLARGQVAGHSTGLRDVDQFARLEPGKLWILAGRPGMGKSALAGHLALSVARQSASVLVFSLEMSRLEWIERLACSLSGVNSKAIRSAQLNQADMTRLSNAINAVSQLPILIDDTESLSLWQLRSRAIATKAQRSDLALVVVDYLQLVRASLDRADSNREQEVAEISRSSKALSKQLDCTVLQLAQLNRACEQRADKRPMLSDLRESGAIEQDADVVTFVYRDEVYNKDSRDKGVAEVLFAKNRSGEVGAVRTAFDAARTKFADLEEHSEPPQYRAVPAVPAYQEPQDESLDF